MVALTVTAPFPLPEAGEDRQPGGIGTGAPAQGAAGVTDGHGLRRRDWRRPAVAVKESAAGLAPMAGAAATVKATATDCDAALGPPR